MKYTKQTITELIHSFTLEANSKNKNLWMITLHPGYMYAKGKDWRNPSQENITLASKGFIGLMNSFLTDSSKPDNYVKSIVALEKSEHGKWHAHIIIQQTYPTEDRFIRKLNRLIQVVNSPNYQLKIENRPHTGSVGIGYQNQNGQYAQYQKCDENLDKICNYFVKSSSSTMINILNSKVLNDDFYQVEPEFITKKKIEFAEKETLANVTTC